jgi:uncharacterized protein
VEENLKFSFLPAEVKFFDYFEKASTNLLNGARLLQDMLEHYADVESRVAQITEIEHRGDVIVHEATNLLARTLITPIDGDEIQRMISSVDDALDAVDAVAQCLITYQVAEVKEPARRLAGLIVEAAQELGLALNELRDKKKYPQVKKRIIQINTLEDNADRVLHDALCELVAHRSDWFDFFRWKEIFELLEATTDRIEDAGDIIQRVMISNA